jgi:outer membrane protein assembly factor BamA
MLRFVSFASTAALFILLHCSSYGQEPSYNELSQMAARYYRGSLNNAVPDFHILLSVTLQELMHKARLCALVCVALSMMARFAPVLAAAPQAATQASGTQQSATLLQAYVGQKVSSVELAGRTDLDDRELLPLIVQRAGEPFDRDKVERSVAAIKATGKFQDVQVTLVPDLEGVRVLLVLQPGLYFGIYEFPGSKNFAYSRLIQASNYPPEGPFNRSDVAQASASLSKFFQQSGYFEVKVSPQIEPDEAHGIVNVRFEIQLGRKAKFGKLTLDGASEAETARLRLKLKSTMARLRGSAIREGKPYTLKTLQNSTVYMQNMLAKEDRLGAEV